MAQSSFSDGSFYRFSQNVYWLMIANFMFVLSNILFIAVFLLWIPTITNAILFYIASLPIGPAIAALCHSLTKFTKDKDISPMKTYLESYRKNGKEALKVWLPIITVVFILVIDIQYFQQNPTVFYQILNGIFLVVLFLMTIFTFYSFLIMTHYRFRLRDIYRLSVYYLFTWIKVSTGNLCIVFLSIALLFLTSDFIVLFLGSVLVWVLVLNSRTLLKDVKISFVKEEQEELEEVKA